MWFTDCWRASLVTSSSKYDISSSYNIIFLTEFLKICIMCCYKYYREVNKKKEWNNRLCFYKVEYIRHKFISVIPLASQSSLSSFCRLAIKIRILPFSNYRSIWTWINLLGSHANYSNSILCGKTFSSNFGLFVGSNQISIIGL